MQHKHLLSLLQNNFKTISVKFVQTDTDTFKRVREYTYKAPLDMELKEGDLALVMSPNTGISVVEVVTIHSTPKIDLDASFEYKWIVQKVDLTGYNARLKAEEDFKEVLLEIERTRQREILLQEFKNNLPEGSQARIMFDKAVTPFITLEEKSTNDQA